VHSDSVLVNSGICKKIIRSLLANGGLLEVILENEIEFCGFLVRTTTFNNAR
jgi:hypothetical protein